MKIEEACCSETSTFTYKITRCHDSKDHKLNNTLMKTSTFAINTKLEKRNKDPLIWRSAVKETKSGILRRARYMYNTYETKKFIQKFGRKP
jgi:hypothetical protein